MTKYRGFAIRIQINIHKKGAVACNYSMEWNAQNSKFHQCECGFSTDHSRYNKHLFLWLFSIPVFLISFFYVNIGENLGQFSIKRGLFYFLANIVVKSDRKMASKNSFQSTDGQSQKMGEKTQQVLRLIAALISSYLFCWETDTYLFRGHFLLVTDVTNIWKWPWGFCRQDRSPISV